MSKKGLFTWTIGQHCWHETAPGRVCCWCGKKDKTTKPRKTK